MSSLTIADWCARHKLSRAFFYKLDARGEAPKTFNLGRIRRITEAADREWLAKRMGEEK